MGILVGHKFSPRGKTWLRVAKDLPGDVALRYQWSEAVAEVKPHGIIFMIDGRSDCDVSEASEFLKTSYSDGPKELIAFHLFINFADKWAEEPTRRRKRIREVEDQLDSALATKSVWYHLRLGIHATHLCSDFTSWPDAERALEKFAVDLAH
jgi:hypothetical protein